jgi:hypothetical protein
MASIDTRTTGKSERRYTVRFRDPANLQQQKTFRRKLTPSASGTPSRRPRTREPTLTHAPGT